MQFLYIINTYQRSETRLLSHSLLPLLLLPELQHSKGH